MKVLFVEGHFVGLGYINMMNIYTNIEADVSKTNVVMSFTPKRCEANAFSDREVSCLILTAEGLEGENVLKGNPGARQASQHKGG